MSIDSHIAMLTGSEESEVQPEPEQEVILTSEEKAANQDMLDVTVTERTGIFVNPEDEQQREVSQTPVPDERDAMIARLERESAGRLAEINGLREKYRDLGEGVDDLRKLLLEKEEREQEEADRMAEAEEFGDVIDDPAVRYLKTRLDKVEEDRVKEREERENRVQELNRRASERKKAKDHMDYVANYIVTSENAYKEAHPTYDAAYDHLRKERSKWYTARGFDEATVKSIVDQEEYNLVIESIQGGKDIAAEIWNMATSFGFSPDTVVAEDRTAGNPPDTTRLKKALNQQRVTSVPSGSGRRDGKMSRAEFFKNVGQAERLRILGDPEKFEELAKTGSITLG
jgi:hypothetical protein